MYPSDKLELGVEKDALGMVCTEVLEDMFLK
jgi:hypothetical protein